MTKRLHTIPTESEDIHLMIGRPPTTGGAGRDLTVISEGHHLRGEGPGGETGLEAGVDVGLHPPPDTESGLQMKMKTHGTREMAPPIRVIVTVALVVATAVGRQMTYITTKAAILPAKVPHEGGVSEGTVRPTSHGVGSLAVVEGVALTTGDMPIGTSRGGTREGMRKSRWGMKMLLLGYRRGCPCCLPPRSRNVGTWTSSITPPLPPGTYRRWRSGRRRSGREWQQLDRWGRVTTRENRMGRRVVLQMPPKFQLLLVVAALPWQCLEVAVLLW
jgi:hypothetical protein